LDQQEQPSYKYSRRFLGKVKDFENKEEQKFENKHLKAYIKGHDKFIFGKEDVLDLKGNKIGQKPKWHTVQQELLKIKINKNGNS
jgi:hypothetical protein